MALPGVRQQKQWFFSVVTPAVRLLTNNKPNQTTYQNLVSSAAFILNSEDSADVAQTQQGLVLKATAADILAATDVKSLGFGNLAISVSPMQLPTVTLTGGSVRVTQNMTTGALNYALPEYLLASDGDVTITSPSTGQALIWNGTVWVNSNIYYGTVESNLTPVTQQPNLNFCSTFSVTNDNTNHCTTICVATNAITYSLVQQTSAGHVLIGNPTGSAANVSEITLGAGLSFSGTTIVATFANLAGVSLTSPANKDILQFNGTNWSNVAPNGLYWQLTGNSGTTAGTNFIGTTDAQGLAFKVNNIFSGWIDYTIPSNTYFGVYSANIGTSTGSDNVSFGFQSMQTLTSGSSNAAFGFQALNQITSGVCCTGIGESAGVDNTTGNYNTYVGQNSGINNSTGTNITVLGFSANVSTDGLTNATAIGSGAIVSKNNTVQIGYLITNVNLGGNASYNLPIQTSSATSGTIVANGAQMLLLTGASASVTITEPASPQTGQQWEISTNQASISLAWTNAGNFYATPPTTVTITQSHKFFFDGTKWVTLY